MTSNQRKPSAHRTVCSYTSPNVIVECVRNETSGATEFVVWSAHGIARLRTYRVAASELAPLPAANTLLAHGVVLLPSGDEDYTDSADLIADVRRFVHAYCDVSDDFEELAAVYVLLSWVYDAFREVPYLRFLGDFGSGKSRCLQVIGSICYKPMFASGASTISPLFRIIDLIRGTLILDEGDFRASDERAEIVKILNNGSSAGFPVLRSETTNGHDFSPVAFTVFGPKLIASRRPFDDRALESRCITERMAGTPIRDDVPLSLPTQFEVEARSLRNRLLTYRFRNHHALLAHKPVSTIPGVEPRISQMFAPLLAVAPNDATRDGLVARAQEVSRALQTERESTLEAELLTAIARIWCDDSPLSMKAIADRFGTDHFTDFRRPITPRWIGSILRSRLGITPVKSHGTFIVPRSDEVRIRALMQRYGVDPPGHRAHSSS